MLICVGKMSQYTPKKVEHFQFLTVLEIVRGNFRKVRLAKSSRRFIKLCSMPFEGKLCSFLSRTLSQNEPEGVGN